MMMIVTTKTTTMMMMMMTRMIGIGIVVGVGGDSSTTTTTRRTVAAATTTTTTKTKTKGKATKVVVRSSLLFLFHHVVAMMMMMILTVQKLQLTSASFFITTTRRRRKNFHNFPNSYRRRRRISSSVDNNDDDVFFTTTTTLSPLSLKLSSSSNNDQNDDNNNNDCCCSLCIIGGGVSGLAAAYCTAATTTSTPPNNNNIIVLESSTKCGGRVQSDYYYPTNDGDYFILDRGFAVFLESYPNSLQLLDYTKLQLYQFNPGALIATKTTTTITADDEDDATPTVVTKFIQIADPLRQPLKLWTAITSPVGLPLDKVRLLPLFYHVVTKSIDYLFEEEEETSTLKCLRERYKFSNKFINEFFKPFLEGIFLAPLNQQSSRLFHFVFKMFTIGSASLPLMGMQAISDQLVEKATTTGNVDIRTNCKVLSIQQQQQQQQGEEGNGSGFGRFRIETSNGNTVQAETVILATDVSTTQKILEASGIIIATSTPLPKPVVRKVGCLYYSLPAELVPIDEPILILNGDTGDTTKEGRGGTTTTTRSKSSNPINNICFPSIVCENYAPKGYHLCSVSILENVVEEFQITNNNNEADDDGTSGGSTSTTDEIALEAAVRKQLMEWFPTNGVQDQWKFLRYYEIPNAQPAQYGVPFPANANANAANHQGGGSGSATTTKFRGYDLPLGLFIAGDHTTTPSLNGALGSGINAAKQIQKIWLDLDQTTTTIKKRTIHK